jgi:hypothetical protein
MDLLVVRARIRQMLDTGLLECEPGKTWAGPGVGDTCAACAAPISAAEIEYEVDLASGPTLRLHAACHRIWMEECESETQTGIKA